MILGLIMQGYRQFARHSLVPAAFCSGRREGRRGVHDHRAFQSRWNRKNVADGPLAALRENCFVLMIKQNCAFFARQGPEQSNFYVVPASREAPQN